MSQFRTKREAQDEIERLKTDAYTLSREVCGTRSAKAEATRQEIARLRRDAARIRALLPSLPEGE